MQAQRNAGAMETTRTPGVFKRGSKYVVPYREPVTGKQRKPAFRTLDDARKFKRNRETDADRGEYVADNRITLHEYAQEWIGRYHGTGKRGFREETREDYRRLLDRYVLAWFDSRLRLTAVSPLHVARFIGWLCDEEEQGQRLADRTVRNALIPLRSCMATARDEGLIRQNPCDKARVPHRPQVDDEDEEDVRAFTRDQLAAFLTVVPPGHRLMFRTLAATGLRVSECIALQWRHVLVDGDRPRLKVRRRIVRGNVGVPKSENSRRDVPLPRALVDEIRAWQKTTEWPGAEDPVFPSLAGTALMKDNVFKRVLKPAAEEAGAGWAGFHTFRHTFASLHIARGTNIKQLSRLLGHHSPSFTLDTYVHLLGGDVGEPLDLDNEIGNTVATSALLGVAGTVTATGGEIAV